jgi:hypothetical protein
MQNLWKKNSHPAFYYPIRNIRKVPRGRKNLHIRSLKDNPSLPERLDPVQRESYNICRPSLFM